MSEPTACAGARWCPDRGDDVSYCDRCDLLVGLDGLHVVEVGQHGDRLLVVVESAAAVTGCRSCGVIATGRGRRDVVSAYDLMSPLGYDLMSSVPAR